MTLYVTLSVSLSVSLSVCESVRDSVWDSVCDPVCDLVCDRVCDLPGHGALAPVTRYAVYIAAQYWLQLHLHEQSTDCVCKLAVLSLHISPTCARNRGFHCQQF